MLVDLLKKEKEELSRLDISKYLGKNDPYYLIYYKPSISDFLSIQNFYADHKKESDFSKIVEKPKNRRFLCAMLKHTIDFCPNFFENLTFFIFLD